MIRLDMTPCYNCENYTKIRWSGSEEQTEYIACSVAESGNANNLLRERENTLLCNKQVKKRSL